MSPQEVTESATVPDECHGYRLDQAVAQMFPQFSRARLQQWIKSGHLLVDGSQGRVKQKVFGGERVEIAAELEAEGDWIAEDIDLDVVFEDDHLLVVNKPIDFVVHPAAGHRSGTLLNALLYRFPNQVNLPRAGIVHRLDKDTSGLMVVAKSLEAHHDLVKQLKAKMVQREYVAVVNGVVTAGGVIDKPIGRHPTQRVKMAVVNSGKEAVTHVKVLARYAAHSLLQLNLETGRTHQIRVHLASIRHPIVGDPLYGGRMQLPKGASESIISLLQNFNVQALHARRLCFDHPVSGEVCSFDAKLRPEMEQLIEGLAQID